MFFTPRFSSFQSIRKFYRTVTSMHNAKNIDWGIIAFPTYSWRVELDLQQGRLEGVRYSPRAVPSRRLLVCTAQLQRQLHATTRFLLNLGPHVVLSYMALLYLVAKPRPLLRAFDPKVSITFLFWAFLVGGPIQYTWYVRQQPYSTNDNRFLITSTFQFNSQEFLPSAISRIGFSIPTARRFSSNVANSRSRAFR